MPDFNKQENNMMVSEWEEFGKQFMYNLDYNIATLDWFWRWMSEWGVVVSELLGCWSYE